MDMGEKERELSEYKPFRKRARASGVEPGSGHFDVLLFIGAKITLALGRQDRRDESRDLERFQTRSRRVKGRERGREDGEDVLAHLGGDENLGVHGEVDGLLFRLGQLLRGERGVEISFRGQDMVMQGHLRCQ